MIRRFDVRVPAELERGIKAATSAVRRGELVVVPTESAYGIATDAFRADGLSRLRHLKQRGPELPVPVLVGQPGTVEGLLGSIPPEARQLMGAFWPGMLTLVGISAPSLMWEVGPQGDPTVSVRMPLHPVALRLAVAVGPLALTGANVAGQPLPTTCDEAASTFGNAVSLYLDAGPCTRSETSSVVDVTTSPPQLLRAGAVSVDDLRGVVPDLIDATAPPTITSAD